MNVKVHLSLPEGVFQKYVRAARQARRRLSAAAPTTEQLMVHALTERIPAELPARTRR